jgi:Outer membrane protein beta-barrel domain
MKLLLAAAAASLLCLNGVAQTKIGIKAGPTFSTAKVTVSGVKQSSSYKPGASIGVQFDVPFDGVLHFSPYAAYNMMASSTKYAASGAQVQTTLHYLSLAPGVSVHLQAPKENAFVIGFTPVLALTSFGNQKTTIGGVTTGEKINFGFDGTGWFDLGLSGSLGYQFKKMFIQAIYYHGLTSINNKEEFDATNIKNRMFSLQIGYFFK